MFQKKRNENRAVWHQADDIPAPLCLVKRGSAAELCVETRSQGPEGGTNVEV